MKILVCQLLIWKKLLKRIVHLAYKFWMKMVRQWLQYLETVLENLTVH